MGPPDCRDATLVAHPAPACAADRPCFGDRKHPGALQSKNQALTAKLARYQKTVHWLHHDHDRLLRQVALLKKQVRPVFYGWKVIGLTRTTVAVESAGGAVRLLRVGDSLGGARVLSINIHDSVVHTSLGDVRPQV